MKYLGRNSKNYKLFQAENLEDYLSNYRKKSKVLRLFPVTSETEVIGGKYRLELPEDSIFTIENERICVGNKGENILCFPLDFLYYALPRYNLVNLYTSAVLETRLSLSDILRKRPNFLQEVSINEISSIYKQVIVYLPAFEGNQIIDSEQEFSHYNTQESETGVGVFSPSLKPKLV